MSWTRTDLASVVSVLESGSRPKGGASTESGEIPSLGGENILSSGGVTLDEVKRVPFEFYKRMNKGHLTDDDVLINKDGAQTGKVGLYRNLSGSPSCINEHLFLIRGESEKITQQYLYYTLLSQPSQLQIDAQISGSAQPGLKSDFLRGVFGDIPDTLSEQTKIAEILSTVDQAIEQTEALIAKQEHIKTGLMQDLLTRGIDENGNLRSEETHEFKDSAIGRIPVEWKVLSIDSISDFVTSGARGWAKYYSDEGAVFFRIGNLTRDHINLRFDDIVFVQPSTSAEGMRTLVRPNDILISITADLGIIGVIPTDFREGYVNQHIALIRISGFEVNQRFIGWFLQSRAGQIQIEKHNESGAKAGLNLPTIRSLLIATPPLSEQGRIAQVLDEISNIVSHLQAESRKQRHLKAALMQDLLTGAVSVASLLTEAEVDA